MHGSGGRKKDRGRRKKGCGWVIRAGVLLGSRYVPPLILALIPSVHLIPAATPRGRCYSRPHFANREMKQSTPSRIGILEAWVQSRLGKGVLV